MNGEWTRVGNRNGLSEGIHPIRVGGRSLVLGVLGGSFVAFSAFCPHMRGPMAKAEVDELIVSCPLHGWRFDLNDNGKELHGYRPLEMYPTKLEGDDILVCLP